MKSFILHLIIITSLFACVSPKIHNKLRADFDQTKSLIGHLVGIEDGIVKISNHKEDCNIRLECIKKAQLDLG